MSDGDRTRIYWDKELECLVEIKHGMNHDGPQKLQTPTGIIKDLPDFVAPGIASKEDPRQPMVITRGRKQYRDELRTRGLIEVGNDSNGWKQRESAPPAGPTVRAALEQAGFFNGASSIRQLRRQQGRS